MGAVWIFFFYFNLPSFNFPVKIDKVYEELSF